MSRSTVALRDLTFTYDSATRPLFSGLNLHLKQGFTGVIGANGSGKSTLLQLVCGLLEPGAGVIENTAAAVYCQQRTDHPPPDFDHFLEDWDSEAFALRGRLGIETDFLERWQHLSHGERKRAQIGHALWQNPDVLAVDEPTNHIDAAARELLLGSLRSYRGIGLLVSHDRDLLDALCQQCVWLDPPNAEVFSGGYSSAKEARDAQQETATRTREKTVREYRRLTREVHQRREHARKAEKSKSKGGVSRKDSDAREKINRAKLTDSKSGNQLRQLDGRLAQSTEKLAATRVRKTYETGIWLPESRSRRNNVLDLPPGRIRLGETGELIYPGLVVKPSDRIAITGPNGAGKSTLLEHMRQALNVPEDRLVYLPQEMTAAESSMLLKTVKTFPKESLGQMMTIVSRLGSRPAQLLESELPSPGELRKLRLAIGIMTSPHLIMMDEPTNHLDLPSIEALEAALKDCPCALIIVTHDLRFLDSLASRQWKIETATAAGSRQLVTSD